MERVRLQYIDLLKFFAIFSIIALHVFLVWPKAKVMGIKVYSLSSIVRFGVPVFIMISGALLLNRDIEIGSFLKKRVNRIVYPFLFFYIITFIFIALTNHTHEQQNIFAFRWYFWTILGVYLSIPIINKYIQHSSLKEIEYFIYIFIFASIFYQFTYFFEIKQYFYLTLFLSPLGYLVLGYYLSKKDFNLSTSKMIVISIILFILSTSIKICGQLGYIPVTENFVASQSVILSSWLDVSFIGILQAASFFLLCKNIYEASKGIFSPIKKFLESNIISKFVLSVSRASYGMYLINLIPTVMVYYYIQPMNLTGSHVFLAIPLISIIIFLVTWIIIVILSKIPYLKYVSGYS